MTARNTLKLGRRSLQPKSYDEEKLLVDYVARHLHFYMTDFERRTYALAVLRDKAKHSHVVAKELPKQIAAESEEISSASCVGSSIIHEQISHRVQQAFD